MTYLIVGTSDESVGQYINGYLAMNGGTNVCPPYTAIGWCDEGRLVAEAVFNNYTGSNIDIHVQGKITRQRIRDVYKYVFLQLNCNRLTAMLHGKSEKLSSLTRRFGFVYECTLRDYQGTPEEPEDVHVYRLYKNVAMKWMK